MRKIFSIYLLFLLNVKWSVCMPLSKSFTNLIDEKSLKEILQNQRKDLKILDFQSEKDREVYGYIPGSLLVPDILLTKKVEPSDAITSILKQGLKLIDLIKYYNEKEDQDKQVIFVAKKEDLDQAYQTILSLGYKEDKNVIKGYAKGINALKQAGGEVEFPRTVSFDALSESLNLGTTLLIDVRNRSELNSPGQIPRSVCVPLHEILNGAFELPDNDFKERYNFKKPNLNDVFVLTCRSGRRILVAEKYLKGLGYENIRIYPGSYKDWVANGGQTIEADFDLDYDPL